MNPIKFNNKFNFKNKKYNIFSKENKTLKFK